MEEVGTQRTIQEMAVDAQPIQDIAVEFILPVNVETNLRMDEFRKYKVFLTNKDWSKAREMKDQFLQSWTKDHPNEDPGIIPDEFPYEYLQRRQYNNESETLEDYSFHTDIKSEQDDLDNRNKHIYYI